MTKHTIRLRDVLDQYESVILVGVLNLHLRDRHALLCRPVTLETRVDLCLRRI